MSSPSAPTPKLLPWGRLVLLSKKKGDSLPDHYDLSRSMHRIGRISKRSDIVIDKQFISGLHCLIRLQGKDGQGNPLVEIEDLSRYGVWVNSQKVGLRRKAELKKGYVIYFADPNSKEVSPLAYKLEILPSGLTKQNEELHAQVSADEMSVAGRTRKRVHEELQCTQSPTKVVLSPPRPRPVKKLRRVSINRKLSHDEEDEPASEPASEQDNTQATQQSSSSSTRAAGKRRRRAEVPAADSKLVKLQEEYDELKTFSLQVSMARYKMSEQLEQAQKELETLRKENETLEKTYEDELKKAKQLHEEELKKVKEQAAADLAKNDEDAKKKLEEMRHERNVLSSTLNHILDDPKNPQQMRTIVDLVAQIQELRRQRKVEQQELDLQHQQHALSQTTPPSKRQIKELELQTQCNRETRIFVEEARQMHRQMGERFEKVKNVQERYAVERSNLSGSSQSQDSIDAGQLRSDRRSSQLSVASNEHSEPSPGEIPLTVDAADEEAKSGDTSQGRPPLFTTFGARSATADTNTSSNTRLTTLSQPQFYRTQAARAESKTQQGEAEDEETKGNK
ncbi:hypothetical protein F441_09761 [Phytophthora nicotianae CJ01A1]|uniref:FHA domain-containing protein n=2 Tax=Phytophthora nicotianae CJ01A1 TaxID=1317063 RepID=W2WYS7_PHYNI|nr:hypothetical protein F441_09761 [Phytophthora nicotianae CJ01A1]